MKTRLYLAALTVATLSACASNMPMAPMFSQAMLPDAVTATGAVAPAAR